MSNSSRLSQQHLDPLAQWLGLNWNLMERSDSQAVKDFLVDLLDYPMDRILTLDDASNGYTHIELLTVENIPWVVGNLVQNDAALNTKSGRSDLWNQKCHLIDGLTQYILFLTPHYLWIVLPTGSAVVACNLSEITVEELKEKLKFIADDQATHQNQWLTFVVGKLPYGYLKLDIPEILKCFQQDVQASFRELVTVTARSMVSFWEEYETFKHQEKILSDRLLENTRGADRRALGHLRFKFSFHQHLFEEILPHFEDCYGENIYSEAQNIQHFNQDFTEKSFIVDSVTVLMMRILFLRLIEDLGLTKKRRLSNSGLQDWTTFVDRLGGNITTLIQLVDKDLGHWYGSFFEHHDRNLFDWIYQVNHGLEEALQRFILRLNAYHLSGLSTEILQHITQNIFCLKQQDQEEYFYLTAFDPPTSIVDWLLQQTILKEGTGKLLDPCCGKGSFLLRYVHHLLETAKIKNRDPHEVLQALQETIWGFDLNPHAAFLSHFQMIWSLIQFKSSHQPLDLPKIHIHPLNSLVKDHNLVSLLGEEFSPMGSLERDRHQWKYIIGYLPHLPIQSLTYLDEIRELYPTLWTENLDTSLLFLYRALTEWLEPGGFLGVMINGRSINSEAAVNTWGLLYPRQHATLRKIVWLEFANLSKKTQATKDQNFIPLLLVIEKKTAEEQDEIELFIPSTWPSEEPSQTIQYADFFDRQSETHGTSINSHSVPQGRWAESVLSLLRS